MAGKRDRGGAGVVDVRSAVAVMDVSINDRDFERGVSAADLGRDGMLASRQKRNKPGKHGCPGGG